MIIKLTAAFAVTTLLIIAPPTDSAFTADTGHCWQRGMSMQGCFEPPRVPPPIRSVPQEPAADITITELADQIRRALHYNPQASCELKIYSQGTVAVCQ